MLLQDLYTKTLDTGEESTKERRGVIVSYILRNLKTHNVYVYKFIFCEFLNLVNVIGQMYLMDVFFNGYFTTYGSEVLTISNTPPEKRSDPMAKVFPKMSKCKLLNLHLFHIYKTYHQVRSTSMDPLVAS